MNGKLWKKEKQIEIITPKDPLNKKNSFLVGKYGTLDY